MVLLPWKQGSWEPGGGGGRKTAEAGSVLTDSCVCVFVNVCLCSTLLHDLHDLQDSVHVLPGGDQTLKHQHPVVVEHVTVWTAHHLKRGGGGV